MRTLITFILCFIILFINAIYSPGKERITRGFNPGEIYISSTWYEPVYGEERYDAIFFSDDNGQTLQMIYYCEVYAQQEMLPFYLLRDATSGVLYNYYRVTMHRSDDYGYNWEKLDPYGNYTNEYASGSTNGEIYLVNSPNDVKGIRLFQSLDYGTNYTLVNEALPGVSPEVGTEPGELYLHVSPYSIQDSLKIYFSNNSGVDFTNQCVLDTTIGGHVVWGHYPNLYRGVSEGEVYLVTWHFPFNFHIHYSTDYGQSFITRYESEELNLYHCYYFTAGIDQGTFYIQEFIPWYDGIHTMLYIYYSNDTAKTFTVYSHLLDETVAVDEYVPEIEANCSFSCVPNPATGPPTFCFSLPYSADIDIGIYNIHGKCIETIKKQHLGKGSHTINYIGQNLEPGLYFAVLIVNDKAMETLKVLKY